MHIPEHVKVFEITSAFFWLEEGIVYFSPKRIRPEILSEDDTVKDMKKLKEVIGNQKVCMIVESSPRNHGPSRTQRDMIERELNSFVKGLAIISTSTLSKMIVQLFFTLKPPPYPIRIFTDVDLAKDWLKSSCQH
jgi:hypothetical protein